MNVITLPKAKYKSKKRLGRGAGSGKAKTSGRGQKGQKARGKMALGHSHYEGGQRTIIKRLPYRRGKGNSKISPKPIVVDIGLLEKLPASSVVDIKLLIESKIVSKDAEAQGVKILGNSRINKLLTIRVPISKSAASVVEKAKGKVEK